MEVRGRAIGMIEAGMKIKMVAEAVGLSLRTLEYWWSAYKKKRTGRPKFLGRVEKMIISKHVG